MIFSISHKSNPITAQQTLGVHYFIGGCGQLFETSVRTSFGNALDIHVKALLQLFKLIICVSSYKHFVGRFKIERDLKVLKNSSYTHVFIHSYNT